MKPNPEFQRQLWLNCTASTVLWTMGLSALLMAVPAVVWGAAVVSKAALGALWAAAVGYGSVLALGSLSQELRQNTWDWQRLSALTPWQMAWGKWLGATAPAWLYVACFATAGLLAQSMAGYSRRALTLDAIGVAVLWGVVAQVWAMNGVLLGWRSGSGWGGWGWQRALLLPALLLWLLPGRVFRRVWERVSGPDGTVPWWGWELSSTQMSVVLAVGLLGLGLLALWRQLSQRLDVATLPWAWPVGLVGMALLLAGVQSTSLSEVLSWVSCLALLATAYIALYAMPDGLGQWRQVQWHTARRQWRGALQALPLWPVSWVLGMGAGLLWMLLGLGDALRAPIATAALVALFGFQLLRDALMLTGFSLLAGRLRAPMVAFAVAWVVLNALLPLLVMGVVGKPHAALVASGVQPLLGYVVQGGSQSPGWYVAAMLAQAFAALAWCRWVFVRQVVRTAVGQRP